MEFNLDDSRVPCCNNIPPPQTDPDLTMGIDSCLNYDEVNISSVQCGWIWAHLVLYGETLGDKACDTTTGEFTNPVEWMTGTTSNYHPSLTWDFIYGSGYRMKRKIGSRGWFTIMNTNNKADTSWIDTNIDVRTIDDPVYYQVFSKVFTYYASTGPQKIYYPAK